MRIRLFFIVYLSQSLLFCFSCNNKAQRGLAPRNDTTEIIRVLIDSTINLPRLVDIQRLYKNNPFGDSIIVVVTSDSLILRNLPVTYKFKFLSGDSICTLARQYWGSQDFPNYLQFEVWKKNDSVYEALIRNIQIDNGSCLRRVNYGCLKSMSFIKKGNILIAKIEQTMYN